MNENNVEYLKERVFFLGFGDKLDAELQKNIHANQDRFQLLTQGEFVTGDKRQLVSFELDFAKSKQSDLYFFNNYKATLKHEDPAQERSQTFYINKGNGVTAKEAYNLLEGRAVHKKLTSKEGQPYQAWIQLGTTKEENGNYKVQQYHSAWGFDLQKTLDKLPIREMGDPGAAEHVVKSLEKGNLTAVQYERSGKAENMFIEANPRERNVIVYDSSMRRQFQGIKEYTAEKNDLQEGKSVSHSQKYKPKDIPPDADKEERQAKSKKVSH